VFRCDKCANVRLVVKAVTDDLRFGRFEDLLGELVVHRLLDDDDVIRETPLAAAGERGADGLRRSEVQIGRLRDDDVVLRAALGLDALALGGGILVDGLRNGCVLPTKDIPVTPSCSMREVTVSTPPLTIWTTPSGKVASSISSKMRWATSGSFSLGFRRKLLPVATAYGRNHNRIIAGKLNGVTATKGSKRFADGTLVDVGRGVEQRPALHHRRDAAGDLDVLDTASDLAARLRDCLPVFLDENLGEAVLVFLQKLLQLEQRLDAFLDRALGPALEGLVPRLDRVIHFGWRSRKGTCASVSWVAGLITSSPLMLSGVRHCPPT